MGQQSYAKHARNIQKIRLIGDSGIGRVNKRHFNGQINVKW